MQFLTDALSACIKSKIHASIFFFRLKNEYKNSAKNILWVFLSWLDPEKNEGRHNDIVEFVPLKYSMCKVGVDIPLRCSLAGLASSYSILFMKKKKHLTWHGRVFVREMVCVNTG